MSRTDNDKSNNRFKAITPYGRMTGSSRVRVFDWIDHLSLDAATISLSEGGRSQPGSRLGLLGAHLRSAVALRKPGTILVHREPSLVGNGFGFRAGPRTEIIYDLDDAIFLEDSGSSRAERVKSIASSAMRVVAGNETLADWASSYCADVVLIPSCVQPDNYESKTDYRISGNPKMGWLGSRTTEPFLNEIGPALVRLNEKYGMELHIIGDESAVSPRHLAGFTVRHPWSAQTQHSTLRTFDFGVMPMPDTPFTQGKCAYKLLQYGAACLPSVASPVGVNAQLLESSDNLAAQDTEEWYQQIDSMITLDEKSRAEMGNSLSRLVAERYSFAANQHSWATAMEISHIAAAEEQPNRWL